MIYSKTIKVFRVIVRVIYVRCIRKIQLHSFPQSCGRQVGYNRRRVKLYEGSLRINAALQRAPWLCAKSEYGVTEDSYDNVREKPARHGEERNNTDSSGRKSNDRAADELDQLECNASSSSIVEHRFQLQLRATLFNA